MINVTSPFDTKNENRAFAPVRWVDFTIEVSSILIAVLSITVIFVALLAEVVIRYITNQGMGWPTEVPNLLFPWLVMSGIVLAAQRGKHIAISSIQNILSKQLNLSLMIFLQLLITFTFFYLGWVGLSVIEITGSEVFPVTGISANWAYLSIVVGFNALGLTGITTTIRLIQAKDPMTVRTSLNEETL